MDNVQFKTLPLKAAYELLEANGYVTDAAVLRDAIQGKESNLRRAKRGMVLEVLRSKHLFDKFISECWPNGATEDGARRIARYEKYYQQWKESSDDTEAAEEDAVAEETLGADADTFAYESDLRDYLAKNLSILEAGMTLWPVPDGQSAVEFAIDDNRRRIDILAKDQHGTPVVIELKVNRGHEKVIGQALYYKECVKSKFDTPSARIVLVAREISQELRVASKSISDIGLYEPHFDDSDKALKRSLSVLRLFTSLKARGSFAPLIVLSVSPLRFLLSPPFVKNHDERGHPFSC